MLMPMPAVLAPTEMPSATPVDVEVLASLIDATSVFGLPIYVDAVILLLGTLAWGAMPPR
jgi:hypothetical protein